MLLQVKQKQNNTYTKIGKIVRLCLGLYYKRQRSFTFVKKKSFGFLEYPHKVVIEIGIEGGGG